MFGTAVEQLEATVDELVGLVASIDEGADLVAELEAKKAVLALERVRERFEATTGSLLVRLENRGVASRDGAYSMANWLASRTGQDAATGVSTRAKPSPGPDVRSA